MCVGDQGQFQALRQESWDALAGEVGRGTGHTSLVSVLRVEEATEGFRRDDKVRFALQRWPGHCLFEEETEARRHSGPVSRVWMTRREEGLCLSLAVAQVGRRSKNT